MQSFWLDSKRTETEDYSIQIFKGKEDLMNDEAKKDSKLRKGIEMAKREANGENILEAEDAKLKQEQAEKQEKKRRKKMEEAEKRAQKPVPTSTTLDEESDEDAREKKRKTPAKSTPSSKTPSTPSKSTSNSSASTPTSSKPKPVNISEGLSSTAAKPKPIKSVKASKPSETSSNSKTASPVPVVPTLEELTTMKNKLEEAIGKIPQNTAKIQQMLTYLMDNCLVNRYLLETVPIGKIVAPLKKHAESGIANASKQLVEKWKEVVKKEASETATADNQQSVSSNGSQKLESIPQSPTGVKKEEDVRNLSSTSTSEDKTPDSIPKPLKKLQKVKPEEKSPSPSVVKAEVSSNNSSNSQPQTTNISASNETEETVTRKLDSSKLPNLKDPNRDYLVKAIATALFELTHLDKTDEFMTDCIDLSVKIEHALFQNCGSSQSQQYREKCRTIAFNIKAKNNPEFRFKVVSGVFTPEQICQLSPLEIASKSMRAEIDKMRKQKFEESKVQAPQKIQSEGLITCGRCKKKNVSYFEMQTRSADEPMTVFCECNNCGHKFKF